MPNANERQYEYVNHVKRYLWEMRNEKRAREINLKNIPEELYEHIDTVILARHTRIKTRVWEQEHDWHAMAPRVKPSWRTMRRRWAKQLSFIVRCVFWATP